MRAACVSFFKAVSPISASVAREENAENSEGKKNVPPPVGINLVRFNEEIERVCVCVCVRFHCINFYDARAHNVYYFPSKSLLRGYCNVRNVSVLGRDKKVTHQVPSRECSSGNVLHQERHRRR